MELLIVHITDIHVKDEDDLEILSERINSFCGAICTHITDIEATELIFCITGDLAAEGLQEQYLAVEMILDDIFTKIKMRFPNILIHVLLVPGNHDCDFKDSGNTLRQTILASSLLDTSNTEQIKICTSIQKNFFEFCEALKKKYNVLSCVDDKILTINEIKFVKENICMKFHCINTSWCSKIHEVKGGMKITTDKMTLPSNISIIKDRQDIIITMMHHSAEWMEWDDIDVWKNYHKKYSDIILVGHEHRSECIRKSNYDNTTNEYIMGNQLYDKKNPNQSGFSILKIKTNENPMQESFFSYEWNGSLYVKKLDTGYRPFIKNKFCSSGIELKEEVQKYIEDIGFDIVKGKRVLKLSDIFGFPTLKEENKKSTRFYRNIDEFTEYIEKKKYVVIRGRKEYGKTALLKQLFKFYYEKKQFPVFMDVGKINSADGEVLNNIIGELYLNTYDNIVSEEILQKDASERVCLIDNFEEIALSDKSAKKLLQYLTNKFAVVIISKNNKLDIANPVNYMEMNDYIKNVFGVLEIQPARRSYMDRIVSRWVCLDEDIEIESVEFNAKKKTKYTEIGNVMKGNYFNGTPTDLLLVLSYLEQEHLTQVDYSRYSFIYDSLILSKLNEIGNNEAKIISAYKKILQSLAYKMYKDKKEGYVDEAYIISVILDYKEKHSGLKKDVSEILNKLVETSFLERKNCEYKFKQSYMLYYFIGSYIDKNLSQTDRISAIKDIFLNMDQELNYNVALFLSNNMSVEHDILPVVKEMEKNLLLEYESFKYEDIKKIIEEWGGDIEKRVKKIYTVPENQNIPILREEIIKQQEEIETQDEDNVENRTEEELEEINSDVLKIGRLVDYMGNVLKNYAGGMEDDAREEMIDLMVCSARKSIGAFFSFSMYIGARLIDLFEEKIKEGGDDSKRIKTEIINYVKSMFAEMWSQFVSSIITGLAACLECDTIKENVANYCMKNQTDFVKMVNVEFLLRIADTHLPVNEIQYLFEGKTQIEEISKIIMKSNIHRYLSSYQFDDNDRKAVCAMLEFNIKDVFIEREKLQMLKNR